MKFTSQLLLILAAPLGAPSAQEFQMTGEHTVVSVTDTTAEPQVTSGKWRLGGTLEVQFSGRIQPHENSVVTLFGGDVEAVEGKFDQVVVRGADIAPPFEDVENPAEGKISGDLTDTTSKYDWLYDIEYGPKSVVLKNFRPMRAPAFPSAEGFGKYTIGGRGGKVYIVSNLNDNGPGSLREALEAKGPRFVVFAVSGTIALEDELGIEDPYITVAGQTAPGGGICVKNYQVEVDADHVILRYLHFRPGDEAGKEQDAFSAEGDHIVVDHCSVSWGVDETLSINKGSNITVQWCMVTESLTDSIHKKGKHGYGGLWGGPGGSFHHNILAHHTSRTPRASGNKESGLLDHRNNVIYNWGFNSAYGGEMWPRNFVNNYYKSGPATRHDMKHRIFLQKDPRGKMYAAGNYVSGFPEISKDNWNGGIDFAEDGEATEATLRVDTEYVVAPVTTQSAEEAYALVLEKAGASLVRDTVDARIIEEIRNGTAQYGETYAGGGKGIIDSQKAVGGWPELQSASAPPDGDLDGMPDAWETGKGLDPAKDDSAADRDGDGYTNIEEYVNSIAP